MEPDRAIEITQYLVDGIAPYRSELFPSGSPHQQADALRALHLALQDLAKPKCSTTRKTCPSRPWPDEIMKQSVQRLKDREILDQDGNIVPR